MTPLALAIALAFQACCNAIAEQQHQVNLAERQARSVHLWYRPVAPAPKMAEATVRVTETQTNSYFMALGWSCGYCGLQDWGDKRVFIFSVWESEDLNDPKAVESHVREDDRARMVYAADDVMVGRFGGEGTGVRTLVDIGWKVGEPVTARIVCKPENEERMLFTAYVKKGEQGTWRKIATLSTICRTPNRRCIDEVFSFVEDFWRNGDSAKVSRSAEFSNIRTSSSGEEGDWVVATKAQFTADPTPSNNIDAGRTDTGAFFLQTGGATTNSHVKLWKTISL